MTLTFEERERENNSRQKIEVSFYYKGHLVWANRKSRNMWEKILLGDADKVEVISVDRDFLSMNVAFENPMCFDKVMVKVQDGSTIRKYTFKRREPIVVKSTFLVLL